jgi:hypothetical protein
MVQCSAVQCRVRPQDSTSEYKDSGIEGEAEVEPELDSLPR